MDYRQLGWLEPPEDRRKYLHELMADYLVPKAGSFYPYYILLQTMHMARHFVLEHHSSTAARSISATRLPASTTDAMPFLHCRDDRF